MKFLASLILIVLALTTGAEARRYHHHRHAAPVQEVAVCWGGNCGAGWDAALPQFLTGARKSGGRGASYAGSGTVVGHPTGCPARRFCGCGAAVRVFGTPRRDLWLAANWLRFPRAAPAPGMVAARHGHVFVLESHLDGDVWMAYDANSGGHATRIHPRPISGYTIVNPRA